MCGIVGAVRLRSDAPPICEPLVTRMRDALVHRGPDGGQTWASPDGRVVLGHRRLSIIDLSAAADQPMANEDDSLRIVFNGEIYNHAEIRAELEQTGGHVWRTDHSDTEVILHAFEQWGIDAIHRFRGMFAFAMWDAKRQELWLVRDRIGVKPLYFSIHHGRLAFASEIKALLKDPEQPRALDEEALFHYLSFLTTPAPRTLFAGIHKLSPGTWLRIRADGAIQEHRYWDAWDNVTPMIGVSDEEIAERVLDELRTAVRLRKVADVPVGVFLSGGIDSSTNAALFSEDASGPIKTFTIGYQGTYSSYTNETSYAARMAREVGADHHERLLTIDDLLRFLPEMVRLQDEPIADPVCVPVYYVSELARREGVVVCQVGEGADELFCGYPSWTRALALQRWDDLPVPRIAKRAGLAALRALGKDGGWHYEYLRRGATDVPVFWGGAETFTDTGKRRVLSPRLRRSLADLTSWEALRPIHDRFVAKAWEPSALHWMTYLDLNLRLPELLLMRVDKMSMGVSLEGRVPFLDHRFVELALSIPTATKLREGNKYVLKRAVRGLIPDELIDRRKQGFGVPVYEWLFDRLGVQVRRELQDFCGETDVLDWQEVERLMAGSRGQELWTLLNLAMWWKEYLA